MARPPGGTRSGLAKLRFTSALGSAEASSAWMAPSTCSRRLVMGSWSFPVGREKAGHAGRPLLSNACNIQALPHCDLGHQDEYDDSGASADAGETGAAPRAAEIR